MWSGPRPPQPGWWCAPPKTTTFFAPKIECIRRLILYVYLSYGVFQKQNIFCLSGHPCNISHMTIDRAIILEPQVSF